MQIECILKRDGGTKADIDEIEYHFAPQPDGAHVAEVEREAHIRRFLNIPEAYRKYGAPLPAAAPVDTPDDTPVLLPQDAGTVVFQGALDAEADSILYGSSSHPASFEIHGTTYSLGDIVAKAHQNSGLTVQEWNDQDEDARADRIDEVLDSLQEAGEADPRDTNGDGTVDSAEERAALVAQYRAKFGKSPGNLGTAKIRAALEAE